MARNSCVPRPGCSLWLVTKPHAEKIAALGLFHRSKRVIGRAKHLRGHCYVCAAHLYQYRDASGQWPWASVLCGALLYVKGLSIPALAGHLRLPTGSHQVWIVDRGILSRTWLRALEPLEQFALGRLRSNQVVYFAPRRQPRKGRKRIYGQKCRVDRLREKFPERLRAQGVKLRVQGKPRAVEVYDAEVLLRGLQAGCAFRVRVLIVVVGRVAETQAVVSADD